MSRDEHVGDVPWVGKRWGALPLDEFSYEREARLRPLFRQDACFRCGAQGPELKSTMTVWTNSPALICVDPIACERRRYRGR